MNNLLQDMRFSLRQLRKSPGFAIAAVLTLALAIGANAVVFAVLNALILNPQNVPQARSLYGIERGRDKSAWESYPDYLDLRDRTRSFDGLAAFTLSKAALDTGTDPSSVWLYETSGNYFDALGIQPYLGRFFHSADEHGPTALRISCSPSRIGTAIFRTIAAWRAGWCARSAIRSNWRQRSGADCTIWMPACLLRSVIGTRSWAELCFPR
jgi:hypothetical protein